jgi:hypothetical protein
MKTEKIKSFVIVLAIAFLHVGFISFAQRPENVALFFETSNYSQKNRIKELVSGVNPTLYLRGGESKILGGNSPICVQLDSYSQIKIEESLNLFSLVELLELRLTNNGDENQFSLNQFPLTSFPSLKCVLVRAEYNLSEDLIEKMLNPLKDKNIVLLYQIVIPE